MKNRPRNYRDQEKIVNLINSNFTSNSSKQGHGTKIKYYKKMRDLIHIKYKRLIQIPPPSLETMKIWYQQLA